METPLLEYDRVEVSYNGVPTLHNICLRVLPGEIVCVVGESGSGKSTLIKAAMGQLGPAGLVTQGNIWYKGHSLPDLPPAKMRELCGKDLALLFQDSLAALNPIRRVGAQMYEAVLAHLSMSREECDRMAKDLLARLGIDDPARVLQSYPFELSGGMGQRVGVAMALICQPRILFADEPSSALDVITQGMLVDLLREVNRSLGTTIVLVTHNMGVVRRLANHVLVLRDGRAVEYGSAAQVLESPSSSYTRELLAAIPRIRQEGSASHG